MLGTAIVILAVAAIGGVILTFGYGEAENFPLALGIGHGLAAVTGVVLALAGWLREMASLRGSAPWGVAALLAATALGAFLFSRRANSEPVSLSSSMVHGGLGLVGLALLLVAIW